MSPPRPLPSEPSVAAPGDDATRVALALLTLLIAAVVAGVVGFAVVHARGSAGASGATVAVAELPVARLEFADGSDALPPDAQNALAPVTESARADAARVVRIQAFRGADDASARHAARRAERVRHAFEADGVSRDQLVVEPLVSGQASHVNVQVD